MTHEIRTRDTRTAQIPKMGRFGAGRRSADQARGPHHLIFDAWQLLTGSQGRFQEVKQQFSAESTMAPSYIYMKEGVPFEKHHQV